MTQRGFTLIELVVVLALLGILASLIAPSFMSYQNKTRLRMSAQLVETSLSEAFSLARSEPAFFIVEAQTQGRNVQLKRCDEGCDCDDVQEDQPLSQSVTNETAFEICFAPPYGDIVDMASEETNIFLTNGDQRTGIKIWHRSGLIEAFIPES